MLRNYFIIAWRNLWNNKVFSLINIVGLAVAMAACLLIYVYISFEKSYDNFHEDGDNIYRLVGSSTYDGDKKPTETYLSPFLGWFLQSNFSEIEGFARLQYEEMAEFSIQSESNEIRTFREEKVFYADPSTLDLFSFPLLAGDPKTALNEPNCIVLTESLANKFFGWDGNNHQPSEILDKTIKFHNTKIFRVTGIMQDIPSNSHLHFSALLSMESVKSWSKKYDEKEGWGWNLLYYRLVPNTNPTELSTKIQELLELRYSEAMEKYKMTFNLQLQPISKIHLHSVGFADTIEVRGNNQIVRFLIIICLFILAIAWTNYINLTTARSMKRAKEVGIKKIVGAEKKQLIEQFLVESIIVNMFALLLAITLAQVSLPYFEQLVGKDLQLELLSSTYLIIIPTFLFLGVIVSGLYPALLLSSVKSISMLSGIKKCGSNRAGLRKALVVMQYMITFSLILGTFTVYMQLSHMRNNALGFNMEQMLIVKASMAGHHKENSVKFRVLKNKIQFHKGIVGVTASGTIPGAGMKGREGSSFFWRNINNEEEKKLFSYYSIDPDFFETYGIKLKYGRAFSNTINNDMESIIIMEQVARDMGFNDPKDALESNLYTTNSQGSSDKSKPRIINPRIIGIVQDFNNHSLKTKLQPTIFKKVYAVKKKSPYMFYSIRLAIPDGGYDQLSNLIALVKKNYHDVFPESAFEYFFLDDFFNQQYLSDQKFGSIIGHFSILAILIACLGMFGLSLFTLQQRTKEIGIRKVHGASISVILILLSKDFIKLIIVSILVAIPITFVPLRGWLQTFAYRIDLSWWLFAIPALVITVIALLTISYQSLKAALANPVKALRYE